MKHIFDYITTELNKNPKRPFLIAIDGSCGSGKTTLGNYLQENLSCSLFHMDDFFLQPHQRTEVRLATPGGNVDYERFQEEVLEHINNPGGITYHPFSCAQWKLLDAVTVPYNDIVIVEGVYSQHPYFKDIYDLKIFLEISEEEQKNRILTRNGEAMWPMFEKKWIPMENHYFETFEIRKNANTIDFFSFYV